MIRLTDLVSERFNDILNVTHKSKGEWVDMSEPEVKDLVKKDPVTKKNIYDLITGAYVKALGEPNKSIQSPNDVASEKYPYWEAINIDDDPDADAVLFGKQKNGVKISGIGHDGEQWSKSLLIHRLIKVLNTNGYWIEASEPVSDVLKRGNAPIVSDRDKIKKLFPDSTEWEFFDDGSYTRNLPGDSMHSKTSKEYVFGNPKI